MTEINDDILTLKEAAKYLKIGESTVYRLAQKGKLPGRKVGGGWRFSRRKLEAWIAGDDWVDEPPAEDGQQ